MLKKVFSKIQSARGRDLSILVLSLLLAFGIWLIHMCTLEYSDIVTVPVIAESNIEGYSRYSTNQGDIAARCRMTGFRLIKESRPDKKPRTVAFAASDFKAAGDESFTLSSAALGQYVKEIFGEGTTVESFVTDDVEFRFYRENHKKVPVQAPLVLDFKPQYMAVEDIRLQPDSVVVYGEAGVLENIDRIMTQTLSKNDIMSSIHGVLRLEHPESVRLSETQVNYSLEVSRYVEVRETVRLRVHNVPAGKSLSVFPATAEVVYRCRFPLGNKPDEDMEFYIDYNDFVKSISGRCVPHPGSLSKSIIDYSIEPQIFECVENFR